MKETLTRQEMHDKVIELIGACIGERLRPRVPVLYVQGK